MAHNQGSSLEMNMDASVLATAVSANPRTGQRSTFDWSKTTAVALDVISIVAGLFAGLFVYGIYRGDWFSNESLKLFGLGIQFAAAFILFGRGQYLYRHGHSLLNIRQTAGVLRTAAFCVVLQSLSLLFGKIVVPRLFLVLSWSFITVFILLQKHLSRRLLAGWRARRTAVRNVLIVGTGSEARRIFSFLLNSPEFRLKPVAFLDEDRRETKVIYSHDYRFRDHAPVYSGPLEQDLISHLGVSEVFVADGSLSQERLRQLQFLASETGVDLAFVGSAHPQLSGRAFSLAEIDGMLVTSITPPGSVPSIGYEIVKRTLDIVGALSLILACLPVGLVVCALVKLSSPGPIFFRQKRAGQRGKLFEMYKFRSMYTTAPKYGRSPEEGDDPRITPVGRFLRKTSLDELPQLLNVLLGNMSLVGPRPEMPYVVRQYTSEQAQRLNVKQGVTGLWQLSADRKHAIHDSIEYDLYYLEHRSFFLDLAILLHTAAFAMKGI